jgi:hypothetical protein
MTEITANKTIVAPVPLRVINIGLELFSEALTAQGVTVAQVAWAPPAQGDQELIDILADLM